MVLQSHLLYVLAPLLAMSKVMHHFVSAIYLRADDSSCLVKDWHDVYLANGKLSFTLSGVVIPNYANNINARKFIWRKHKLRFILEVLYLAIKSFYTNQRNGSLIGIIFLFREKQKTICAWYNNVSIRLFAMLSLWRYIDKIPLNMKLHSSIIW